MKGMLQKFLLGSQAQARVQASDEAAGDVAEEEGDEGEYGDEDDEMMVDAEGEAGQGEEQDELEGDINDPEQVSGENLATEQAGTSLSEAGDQSADAEDEQIEDVVLVVKDSFKAASPPAHADDRSSAVIDDDLEIVSASCVCVHGSQDSDVEIQDDVPTPARPPSRAAGRAAAHDSPLPFGAAAAEVAGTVVAADADFDVDFAAIEKAWTATPDRPLRQPSPARASIDGDGYEDALAGAGVDEQEEAAEATLSRVVSKQDFEAMEVVGQFNLGFIIARRKVVADAVDRAGEPEVHDDLFIIDQHASDEKYNFERLQAQTVIQSQRLLACGFLHVFLRRSR